MPKYHVEIVKCGMLTDVTESIMYNPNSKKVLTQSIHPLSAASPGVGSRGQQLEQRNPDVPVPGHFLQLFRGDPEAFPGQPRDIVNNVSLCHYV